MDFFSIFLDYRSCALLRVTALYFTPFIFYEVMTPLDYCQKKIPFHSDNFFSLLFSPRSVRSGLLPLYALYNELDNIGKECSDTAVAHAKLGWWQQELASAFAGNPSHPVTRALTPVIQEHRLPEELFMKWVDAIALSWNYTGYKTFEELKTHCLQTESAMLRLIALTLGRTDSDSAAYADTLSIALRVTKTLRDAGQDVRRGVVSFPAADLHEFDLTDIQFLTGEDEFKITTLLAFETVRARQYYDQCEQQLPQAYRESLLPLMITAAIGRLTLTEIGKEGYAVLNRRLTLTPLHKFWVAWRAKRTA